ncbi:hypothetical protein [Paenibacillus paeoniae]|nr:hypothetical protein [Paenibacillus paeoniae]
MNVSSSSVKIGYYSDNVEQLIKDTDTIIEGVATNIKNSITLEGVRFVETKVLVIDVLKGGLEKDKEIWLLQTKVKMDPIIGKNDRVLLFLEK